MKEDFLHYLWKYQKFTNTEFVSTDGVLITVVKVGHHNTEERGPDFFESHVIIDHQKWVGNVEVHVKSSDWFAHQHHYDTNYDNVILHVVWEDDTPIFRSDETQIPTLQLKDYTPIRLKEKYEDLFNHRSKPFVYCESYIGKIDSFKWYVWYERLYLERLEEKSLPIQQQLSETKNDWEATFFCFLAKAFGSNTNGQVFFEMARSIPFSIVQKADNIITLEALFFGQLQMLSEQTEDSYEQKLFNIYVFLKQKHKLTPVYGERVKFFKLRPANFPTVRLAQLAALYLYTKKLFSKLMKESDICYSLFHVKISEYWQTHYTFGKESVKRSKKISKTFIDSLYINAILPIAFLYSKVNTPFGFSDIDRLINILEQISPESNYVTKGFSKLKVGVNNAYNSQALLQLHKHYCSNKRCLECEIGNNFFRN